MKNQILNMGQALTRKEQKQVMGGGDLRPIDQAPVFNDPNIIHCTTSADCPDGRACINLGDVRFDDKQAYFNPYDAGWTWSNFYICEI